MAEGGAEIVILTRTERFAGLLGHPAHIRLFGGGAALCGFPFADSFLQALTLQAHYENVAMPSERVMERALCISFELHKREQKVAVLVADVYEEAR